MDKEARRIMQQARDDGMGGEENKKMYTYHEIINCTPKGHRTVVVYPLSVNCFITQQLLIATHTCSPLTVYFAVGLFARLSLPAAQRPDCRLLSDGEEWLGGAQSNHLLSMAS